MRPIHLRLSCSAAAFSALFTAGCASVTAENPDPYEDFNRQMFAFNEGLDRAVIEPVAYGYRALTNEPIREGVGNFSNNLGEPLTFVNHVLQGKLPDAGATLGRFVVNTTVGIAGVFDPASAMGMQRTNEDFGQTLGVWGVDSGPFIVLPFLGPSNPRDVVGRWVPDGFGEPIVIGGVSIRTGDYLMADRDGALIIPAEIIDEVTIKVEEVLRTENKVRTAILQGVDPVEAYLKHRKF